MVGFPLQWNFIFCVLFFFPKAFQALNFSGRLIPPPLPKKKSKKLKQVGPVNRTALRTEKMSFDKFFLSRFSPRFLGFPVAWNRLRK